jgi:uncharacterized protein
LLRNPTLDPEIEAASYVKPSFETEHGAIPGVADAKAALEGARQILMDPFAEDAELLGSLRNHLREHGVVTALVAEGKEEAGAKFGDYFAYSEPYLKVAPHRALALFRGRKEEILRLAIKLPEDSAAGDVLVRPMNTCENRIAGRFAIADRGRKADAWLLQTARWTWGVKLAWQLETELFVALREVAEAEAIRVFAMNLNDLLLAAPAGNRVTLGLDPGLRTGVKIAVIDRTGKLVGTATVYPHVPKNDWEGALRVLGQLAQKHDVELIRIGNGTASRETDKLAADLIKRHPELRLTKVVVSEAGASVYSASELASREFPQIDVSIRGAISIARRLQDPLAELVKIDPKSIGVGQYQHDTNGPFRSHEQLKAVPRLGPKTFEQAAGFLRIPAGANPLDASSVHPEAYPVVERILADLQSNKFVRDPREVVKAGDVVKVKVLEVDAKRRRVALSMKLDAPAQPQTASQRGAGSPDTRGANHSTGSKEGSRARPANQDRSESRRDDGALAEALQRALRSC